MLNNRRVLPNLAALPVFRDRFKVTIPLDDSGLSNIQRSVEHCTTLLNDLNLNFRISQEDDRVIIDFRLLNTRNAFLSSLSTRLRVNSKYALRTERTDIRFLISGLPRRIVIPNNNPADITLAPYVQYLIFNQLITIQQFSELDLNAFLVNLIGGTYAVALSYDENLSDYLLVNPVVNTSVGSLIVVRYAHVNRCRRCTVINCSNTNAVGEARFQIRKHTSYEKI